MKTCRLPPVVYGPSAPVSPEIAWCERVLCSVYGPGGTAKSAVKLLNRLGYEGRHTGTTSWREATVVREARALRKFNNVSLES